MWPRRGTPSEYYFVYVLYDFSRKDRFKIGFSSDPEQRAKDEDRRIHGKFGNGPSLIQVKQFWQFRSENAARFIEGCFLQSSGIVASRRWPIV